MRGGRIDPSLCLTTHFLDLDINYKAKRWKSSITTNNYHILSAFHMPTPEKEQQERRPLLSINDHFRKIVIVGDDIHRKEDELGALTVGLLDFLTDKKILEQG